MNKKIKSCIIFIETIFFIINFLLHSELFIDTFYHAIRIWFYNLLPSIVIFFTISDILNNYQIPYYINKIFGKLVHKIYKLPPASAYILIMSMFQGFPGNSQIIKNTLDLENISEYDATKLLTMTHFFNPLFIIFTIGIKYLQDIHIGFIILLVHYLTNYLIGYFFKNIYTIETPLKNEKLTDSIPFISLLKSSFYNTFKTLITVLGIIIFFSICTTILNQYLNLNSFSMMIVNNLLEITSGLDYLNILHLSKIKNATLITFFISFGGFSIHMQIMSILNKYHINYYIYLLSRIMHASISSIIVFLILINC